MNREVQSKAGPLIQLRPARSKAGPLIHLSKHKACCHPGLYVDVKDPRYPTKACYTSGLHGGHERPHPLHVPVEKFSITDSIPSQASAEMVWKWPWMAAGPSGFGSWSTAEQVTEGVDASQITAIVTGATNGIGKETARVLALRGAKVIIPSRTLEGSMKLKEILLEQNPNAKLLPMEMDLSSLDSVKSFARSFNSSNKHLNILINNAGIMACPFELSKDGIELQFATNHLGHFLLTNLLLDKMKATAKETGIQGRIVNVSSIAHKRSDGSSFDIDKLNDQSRYKPFIAYSHSKLANILHANELSRRLQEEGTNVTANSLHPGVIFTNIGRYLSLNVVIISLATVAKPLLKSIPQGAATTCYLALNPKAEGITGKYFADCNEATPTPKARDQELGRKLWDFSQNLVEKVSRKK